jgi:hypothetical protein
MIDRRRFLLTTLAGALAGPVVAEARSSARPHDPPFLLARADHVIE